MTKFVKCAVKECNKKASGNMQKDGFGAFNCKKHLREFNQKMKETLKWGVENPEEFLKANKAGTQLGIQDGLQAFNEEIEKQAKEKVLH